VRAGLVARKPTVWSKLFSDHCCSDRRRLGGLRWKPAVLTWWFVGSGVVVDVSVLEHVIRVPIGGQSNKTHSSDISSPKQVFGSA